MSKYHSRKVRYNGRVFDSKKEARRAAELTVMENAGVISDLQMQVKFVLIPAQYETYERYSSKTGKRLKDGKRCIEQSVVYVADFVYTDQSGQKRVEDVKGYKQGQAYALFSVKRKLMLYIHGIKVEEI